jgi:ERCC4-related helicase
VSTVAAEEGLDVPQANYVLRFDPVITPVSLVQGGGRAREENSDHVILSERQDRPIQTLMQANDDMHRLAKEFKPDDVRNITNA